jgi:hypothetical protein
MSSISDPRSFKDFHNDGCSTTMARHRLRLGSNDVVGRMRRICASAMGQRLSSSNMQQQRFLMMSSAAAAAARAAGATTTTKRTTTVCPRTGRIEASDGSVFQVVVGLEIHAALQVPTKLFSSAPHQLNDRAYGAMPPNSAVRPFDWPYPVRCRCCNLLSSARP